MLVSDDTRSLDYKIDAGFFNFLFVFAESSLYWSCHCISCFKVVLSCLVVIYVCGNPIAGSQSMETHKALSFSHADQNT